MEGIASFASSFNIDWDIQKGSDAALELRSAQENAEKLRSAPLSSLLSQKDGRHEKELSTETTTLGRSVPAKAGESSTSQPIRTAAGVDLQPTTTSQPSYTEMPHSMLNTFAAGIDDDELRSSLDIRGDSVGISLNLLTKWGSTAIQNQFSKGKGSITAINGDDYETAIWPVHTLLDPETRQTVGLWAPDVSEKEYIVPPKLNIFCLAISRRKSYVWCLGLVPIEGSINEYRRVGLAYWNVQDWDAMVTRPSVTVKIV